MRRMRLWLVLILAVLIGCNGSVSSGDRVLVSKYLWDTNLQEPSRFDVVVFKYPVAPVDKGVPKNYIKRLLGLPGEIIAIFLGQLFRLPAPPPGSPPYYDDLAGLTEENKKFLENNLWMKNPGEVRGYLDTLTAEQRNLLMVNHMLKDFTHSDDDKSLHWFQKGKGDKFSFEILRKSPEVMLALRRIVNDHDYQPEDLNRNKFPKRWESRTDSDWQADAAKGFAHSGKVKGQIDWVRYQHLLRSPEGGFPRQPKPELITDFMDYNAFNTDRNRGNNWVGDLMLECQLTVDQPEGHFILELSRSRYRFRASWDLKTGDCILSQVEGSKIVELDRKPTQVQRAGKYQLRFANFDSRLTVWVDSELPFGDGHDYPPLEIRGPKENISDEDLEKRWGPTRNDLEPASIGSQGAKVQVHHLRLWRDTYYTVDASNSSGDLDISLDLDKPEAWETLFSREKLKRKTLYVQPGHYLCLGDNSPHSSDGRDWGLVPQRLLLGRALLVYWPYDRVRAIR